MTRMPRSLPVLKTADAALEVAAVERPRKPIRFLMISTEKDMNGHTLAFKYGILNSYTPPPGPSYVAAALKQAGHDCRGWVRFKDSKFSELDRLMTEYQP